MLSIPFDEYIDLDGQSLRVRRSRASVAGLRTDAAAQMHCLFVYSLCQTCYRVLSSFVQIHVPLSRAHVPRVNE